MKKNLTKTTIVITIFCVVSSSLSIAAPRGNGPNPRKGGAARIAEKAANKEEALLFKKDIHAWKKDPEARDQRHENLREYTVYTYKRIVRLLTIGAIEEADGTTFKNRHSAIITEAKAANNDGLNAAEKLAIRKKLNTLNDDINAAITEAEKGSARTPIVNRAQHIFEERIALGVKSGRLSTLEASSLRRKVTKLEAMEERLKGGKELSSNERERLMKEVLELRRDLLKALRS